MAREFHASAARPSLLVPLTLSLAAASGVTRNTLVLRRGADSGQLTSTLDPSVFASVSVGPDGQVEEVDERCTFDGYVSLSHPMSLKSRDKFFSTGQLQQRSIEMMVDEINANRCGVGVDGRRYGLSLTTFGDDSSKAKVGAIVGNGMVPLSADAEDGDGVGLGAGPAGGGAEDVAASYWLGPYSSGLTGAMSPAANETGTVMVAGGAASTAVFEGYPTIFGTFPPTSKYLAQAVEALSRAGARTAASLWEDASFTRGVCAALPGLAERHGMTLLSQTEVPASPTALDLDPISAEFSRPGKDPDVVVTCVYDAGCAEWIRSMRRSGWSPRSNVFTVCVGMDKFVGEVGTDAMYMTGISPWDASLAMSDEVVGWTAGEFAGRFVNTTSRTPTYHSASGAASVGVLVQAIERAGTFDSGAVAGVLATGEFETLYGRLSFDRNGQSQAPSLYLQYDANMTVQTVFPPDASSGTLVYPMPTWDERDCLLESTCPSGSEYTRSGTCSADGTCLCSSRYVSNGVGADASCVLIPEEDMTYISSSLLVVGLIFFGLQSFLSVSCAGWTVYYSKRSVVRASQPIFLNFVSLGTFLISATILPLGIQGEYRDDSIGSVDAACMAAPWLFSLGFSIVFSALAAKILRITKVMHAAANFQRKKVEVKDVMGIMVVVVMVQVVILVCWQLIDPMTWQRELIAEDINGYPTQSVGSCQSDHALRYLVPLAVVDFLLLAVALILCFKSRKLSNQFQEGMYIAASVVSMLQILMLAVPILVIVENDTSAFYFVLAVVVFLISFTVQCLIFFPKIYRLHLGPGGTNVRRSGTSVVSGVSPAGRSNAYGTASASGADEIRKLSSMLSTASEAAPTRESDAERRNSNVTIRSNNSSNGGRDSPLETAHATDSGHQDVVRSSRSLVTGVIPSGDDATTQASERGPEETPRIDEEQPIVESGGVGK